MSGLSAVDSAGVATHWPLLLRGGLVSWLRHPEEGCWTLDRDGLRRVLLAITTRDDAGSCYFATVVLRAERTLARPP